MRNLWKREKKKTSCDTGLSYTATGSTIASLFDLVAALSPILLLMLSLLDSCPILQASNGPAKEPVTHWQLLHSRDYEPTRCGKIPR
jgi:hypothetical protein